LLLPDINVLVYAFREDMADHRLANAWLESQRSGPSEFALAEFTLASFLRLVTNSRVMPVTTGLESALDFLDELLATPNVRLVRPGERHWPIFTNLCRAADARGNRVRDAYLAALAIEHGCELATFDRGFGRYPGLHWSVPEL
jgi:hypothetical protein